MLCTTRHVRTGTQHFPAAQCWVTPQHMAAVRQELSFSCGSAVALLLRDIQSSRLAEMALDDRRDSTGMPAAELQELR